MWKPFLRVGSRQGRDFAGKRTKGTCQKLLTDKKGREKTLPENSAGNGSGCYYPADSDSVCRNLKIKSRHRQHTTELPRTKVRGSPVCGNLVIYREKNAYSISPLSFNRSSMSVSFTFFKTTFNISFSLKESLASEMGFLSIA